MPLHRPRTDAAARTHRAPVAAGAVLAAVVLSGCGPSSAAERVDVYAASSLTGVFTELAAAFEEQHPGVDVALSFSGSADLAVQIAEGAPADVFAAADEQTVRRVVDAGRAVGEPRALARNRLTIAVPEGNPLGVRGLADLARADVSTVVCAEQVPCGRAARTLAERAGVPLRPVSEENSVTDVLGKVRSGQADAGLVYVTDVAAHEDVLDGVPLPDAAAAANPCTVLGIEGGDQERAAEFMAFVTGEAGRQRLADAGFDLPPAPESTRNPPAERTRSAA